MINLFITLLNISISVSVLFVIIMIVDRCVHKTHSKFWKHIVFIILGVRLLIPFNFSFLTLDILPEALTPVHNTSVMNHSQDISSIQSAVDTDESIHIPAAEYPITANKDDTANSRTLPVTDSLDNTIDNADNTPTTVDTLPTNSRLNSNSQLNSNSILITSVILWCCGVFVFLSYHLLSYYNFKRQVIRYGTINSDSKTYEILEQIKSQLHIHKDIKLITYKGVRSPLLFGCFKTYIVLPDITFNYDQLEFILRHELTHYQHRDLYTKLLMVLANAIHWFNPFVYLLVKEASLTMEFYCDESMTNSKSLLYRQQYSLTLLQLMKPLSTSADKPLLLSTRFTNNSKQTKQRFVNIMNSSNKKRGCILLAICVCIIFFISNLSANHTPKQIQADSTETIGSTLEAEDSTANPINTQAANSTTVKQPRIINLLVLGLDQLNKTSEDTFARPDSILLVNLNTETGAITVNTILRDLYVDIPSHDSNKISAAYALGGIDLIKETIQSNLGITINHTICLNLSELESIIDSVGGLELALTESEASYLNRTNYISKKEYRNVKTGTQRLNGNQVAGYLRIRYVPTADGITNDYGRTQRLTYVFQSLAKQVKTIDVPTLLSLAKECLSSVTTDMNVDEISSLLETFYNTLPNVTYQCVPAFEDCDQTVIDNRSVIVPNLSKAKESLSQFIE